MFTKIFNRNNEEKKSFIGRKATLIHDYTEYQYGSAILDDKRYSVRTNDGKWLRKGDTVEVLEESCEHGSIVLTVKKV